MSTSAKVSRRTTERALELAILRIRQGVPKLVPIGTKLSIAAVAKEAGVSNSTIHNRYPVVADSIRRIVRGEHSQQLESKQGALKDCMEKLKQAKKEIKQLQDDLAKSQSINLRLTKENELLRK
ncbi:TetR family transcriptional regulator [Burkholderia sp. Tr-20390]|uniref:TetR family transcriptional regulator n=1 Tax=Burkholderia sp. Tr-20390 TaxID=2703904 RepID=UPI00197ED98C|nr:TetR family transcriptional regulator [Burkholderia sp. Tr-20390]MBN3729648.1 TetR family transcriptional regulator [Burkholderia sp. Tr-20390]